MLDWRYPLEASEQFGDPAERAFSQEAFSRVMLSVSDEVISLTERVLFPGPRKASRWFRSGHKRRAPDG